jgi:hypothetical protein
MEQTIVIPIKTQSLTNIKEISACKVWYHLFIIQPNIWLTILFICLKACTDSYISTFCIRCTVTRFELNRYTCGHLKWFNEGRKKIWDKWLVHLKQSCCPESKADDLGGVACSWMPVLNCRRVDVSRFGLGVFIATCWMVTNWSSLEAVFCLLAESMCKQTLTLWFE